MLKILIPNSEITLIKLLCSVLSAEIPSAGFPGLLKNERPVSATFIAIE